MACFEPDPYKHSRYIVPYPAKFAFPGSWFSVRRPVLVSRVTQYAFRFTNSAVKKKHPLQNIGPMRYPHRPAVWDKRNAESWPLVAMNMLRRPVPDV